MSGSEASSAGRVSPGSTSGDDARIDPASIQPVPDDGVRVVTVGLLLWAVAAVVLLTQRSALEERGAQWWLWTCLAGLAVGAGMLVFMRRRATVYRRHREAGDQPPPEQAAPPESSAQ
jgi:hypothetical protein